MDDITDSMYMSLSKLQDMVKDRKAWCAAVHGVARGHSVYCCVVNTFRACGFDWEEVDLTLRSRVWDTRQVHGMLPTKVLNHIHNCKGGHHFPKKGQLMNFIIHKVMWLS